MARRADQLAAVLNEHRNAFKVFVTARVGSKAEAEDIRQDGFFKAVRRSDSPIDSDKT